MVTKENRPVVRIVGDQAREAGAWHRQRHLDGSRFRRASRQISRSTCKLPVLLDTHAFLWWCEDSPELSPKARKAMTAERLLRQLRELLGDRDQSQPGQAAACRSLPDRYLPEQMSLNGFEQLEISFRQIMRTARLPWQHRDPFDRLLVAQALEEELPIVSRDPVFDAYGVSRIW